jgi:hypothetical protein
LKLIKRQESAKLFIESAYKSLEKRIPEAKKYQGASTGVINKLEGTSTNSTFPLVTNSSTLIYT